MIFRLIFPFEFFSFYEILNSRFLLLLFHLGLELGPSCPQIAVFQQCPEAQQEGFFGHGKFGGSQGMKYYNINLYRKTTVRYVLRFTRLQTPGG